MPPVSKILWNLGAPKARTKSISNFWCCSNKNLKSFHTKKNIFYASFFQAAGVGQLPQIPRPLRAPMNKHIRNATTASKLLNVKAPVRHTEHFDDVWLEGEYIVLQFYSGGPMTLPFSLVCRLFCGPSCLKFTLKTVFASVWPSGAATRCMHVRMFVLRNALLCYLLTKKLKYELLCCCKDQTSLRRTMGMAGLKS